MKSIPVKGGWVIECNGFFMGRDKYWAREARHAMPFASIGDAMEAIVREARRR